jgi:hypothetical protein
VIQNLRQDWFEMADLRRRRFATSVWVPLRAIESNEKGAYGRPGFVGDSLYVGSVAFPLNRREEAEKLGWTDIGIKRQGGPHAFSDGGYKPCEVYQYRDGEDLGVDLVFEQQITGQSSIWHLSQDLVLALRLVRDGDSWIRPEENYIEVVRERRDAEGKVVAIEIRNEFLRDYLAARGMALRLVYYRQRKSAGL